jgi:hypothetical protein
MAARRFSNSATRAYATSVLLSPTRCDSATSRNSRAKLVSSPPQVRKLERKPWAYFRLADWGARAISKNDGDRPLRATEDQLVRCRVCVAQAASLSGMRSSCVRPGSSKGAALDRSRPIPQAGSHRGGRAEDVKLESAGADPGILTQKTRGRCHGRRQHVRRRYARCS